MATTTFMRTSALLMAAMAVGVVPGIAGPKDKAGAEGTATDRYFVFASDLVGNVDTDAVLKETRQGGKVTAAVLDVCYSASPSSDRKDRFVANLTVDGNKLVGTAQTQIDKQPVTVRLNRHVTGKNFAFDGTITRGSATSNVALTDQEDLSAAEFAENNKQDDIEVRPAPAGFTDVSPGRVAARVELGALKELVQDLRAENVEIELGTLLSTCADLRAEQQVLGIKVDPERAPALVAKLKSRPGVTAVGYAFSENYPIDNAVRLTATDWREGGKLDRDKLADAVAKSLGSELGATLQSKTWLPASGAAALEVQASKSVAPRISSHRQSGVFGPDRSR